MTMDNEARALVEQLVSALVPLGSGVMTAEEQARRDSDVHHRLQPTIGAAKAAYAAMTAGRAALAATATA